MVIPYNLLMRSVEKRSWSLLILIAFAGLAACQRKSAGDSDFEKLLRESRREKDLTFRSSPNSPLPEEDRSRFRGLSYFDINPDLSFRAKLNRYQSPQAIRLATNTGEIRSGLRYGYFELSVQGEQIRVQVYRLDDAEVPGPPSLFVPFRDATSGKESYGSGRYIDLKENTSGFYDLDFNRAYNPSCAYGRSGFSCPLPPAENTLPVPIRAGEKVYRKHES